MKIEEAVSKISKETKASKPKDAILDFLKSHPKEVFRRREIEKELSNINENTLRVMLRQLAMNEKKIGRYQVPARTIAYYGSLEAVSELTKRLGEKKTGK
ncbi:MAG: hypothetical protein JRN20_14635 [Nitrososphaerota archaeon]|jgi:predicted transcriptional regulator|nr:hypothetical protein [Nitrososphaerota archaeon]MDG6923132.1 hypothetical protein [Nitrososphaerota archaeon]